MTHRLLSKTFKSEKLNIDEILLRREFINNPTVMLEFFIPDHLVRLDGKDIGDVEAFSIGIPLNTIEERDTFFDNMTLLKLENVIRAMAEFKKGSIDNE